MEAEKHVKEQEERIKVNEEKLIAAEEKVQFEANSGQITGQEAEEKRALIEKAMEKIAAMKELVEMEKKAIRKIATQTRSQQ